MIKSTLISTGTLVVPQKIFTASTTGESVAGQVLAQMSAITTIIFCNIKDSNINDETDESALINIHLVKSGEVYSDSNKIVSKLLIPAGETVFFNDERIILDGGDEIWVGSNNPNSVSVTVSSLPV
jgi:hypothetical protein